MAPAVLYRRIDEDELTEEDATAAQYATGSGVLPFCVLDDGSVRFLLGKEQHVENWKGSLRWSAFGGGRKADETSQRTAAREFVEEILGLCGDDVHAMEHSLGVYALRILTRMRAGDGTRTHVTYVKQMQWDPSIVERFQMTREALLAVHRLSTSMRHALSSFPRTYPFMVEGDIVSTATHVECVELVLAVSLERGALRTTFQLGQRRVAVVYLLDDTTHGAAASYAEWFQSRALLTERLHAIETHAAVHARWSPEFGVLLDAKVHADYLEKERIRYWSLSELARAAEVGWVDGEYFRPYFIPVMRTICQEFA